MLLLKRECEEYRVLESVSHLAIKLMNLLAEMERFFEKSSESDKRDQVLELYFKVRMLLIRFYLFILIKLKLFLVKVKKQKLLIDLRNSMMLLKIRIVLIH